MAKLTLSDFKQEYINIYKTMSKTMLEKDSVLDIMMNRLTTEFDNYSLDPTKKSELIAQTYLAIIDKVNKDVMGSVEGVFRVQQISRQTQGYDDNMLVKVAEQQGGVTSFAVNSDSSSAQSAIDSLKLIMGRLQDRAEKVNDTEPDGIVYQNVAIVPTSVTVVTINADGFDLSWDNMAMTDYMVYIDGLLSTTTTGTTYTKTGLTAGKYAINISSRLAGTESVKSNTIIAEVI